MAATFKALVMKVTEREGKKVSLSIAQVSEVVKITLEELAEMDTYEMMALIGKYRKG